MIHNSLCPIIRISGLAGILLGAMLLSGSCHSGNWLEEEHGTYNTVIQKRGPELGYSPASGVAILSIRGKAFKDLNRNGELDPFEDWRLTPEKRAEDLSKRLSIEEIAGLLLCSNHQAIPSEGRGIMAVDVELSDAQKDLMRKPSFVRALRNFFQAAWNEEPYPATIDMSELTPEERIYLSDEKTITAFVAYMMERTNSVQSYNGTTFALTIR